MLYRFDSFCGGEGKTQGEINVEIKKKSTTDECFLKKTEKTEESEQGVDQSYLHPCGSCRSTGVHSLDVTWLTSSHHKAPANCITNNLERKGTISKQQTVPGNLPVFPREQSLTHD